MEPRGEDHDDIADKTRGLRDDWRHVVEEVGAEMRVLVALEIGKVDDREGRDRRRTSSEFDAVPSARARDKAREDFF
jgi:hypothetical protein